MKFEKHLRAEIVPEWRSKYIDYKGLKKRLRYVQQAKSEKEKELTQNNNELNSKHFNSHSQSIFSGNSTPYSNFNNQFNNNNYNKRSSIQSQQQRTFSMTSLASSFIHKVSSALVSVQKQQSPYAQPSQPSQITSLEALLDQVNPEERLFFAALDKELVKIETFYESKERDALTRMKLLEKQYEILIDEKKKQTNREDSRKSKAFVKQGLDYIRTEKYASGVPGQSVDHKTAKKRIKKALFEFYRGVEILRKYCVLNYNGFIKILKKYDEVSGRNGSKIYLKKVTSCNFVKSNVAKKLLKEVEDFYGNHFENGSRSQAMRKLRLPSKENKTYYGTVLRVGFYLGLALPVLVHALELARPLLEWVTILQLYSGLLLPILMLLLLGVNMYGWTKSRINYKFIFELNPRDNLDFRQFVELPSMVLLAITYIMLLTFLDNFNYIQPQSYPIFFAIFAGAVVFNPFPILYYSSRKWFILSTIRLFGSGFLRVEFRDFFISDGLTSLSYSLSMLQLFGCREIECNHVPISTWTPILSSIPALFRLLQCLKRYRDTEQNHHLINLIKYGTTIFATFMAFWYRTVLYRDVQNHDDHDSKITIFFSLWVFLQSVASLYTFSWDVKMDWSLFKLDSANYLLRNELGYSYHWLYYNAIIINFILRWGWVSIVIWPKYPFTGFFVAIGEVIRRCVWNFLRVEYEHVNNCEQTRATKDIALPFQKEDITPEEFSVTIQEGQIEESDYDRSSSFSSRRAWKKIFAKQPTSRHKMSSADSLRDFEPRNDVSEYLYDDIYEESEEEEDNEDSLDENDVDNYDIRNSRKRSRGISLIRAEGSHGLNNAYASRSFLPINDTTEEDDESY